MIITSDGEVVTNNHVIELYAQGGNTGSITVTEYGQTKALPTTLVGYDQTKDVALLKINSASNLPTVTFGNSSKAVVGDAVVAIGNALGLAGRHADGDPGHRLGPGPLGHRRGSGHADRDPPEHDPDRRRHQPGQLRRPADRHVGPGHRHEHRGGRAPRATGRRPRTSASPSRPPGGGLHARSSRRAGSPGNGGGYLGRRHHDPHPCAAPAVRVHAHTGAVILSVVSGSPAAKAGLVQGDVIVDIDGHRDHLGRGPAEGDPELQAGADGDDHLLRRRQQADHHRPRWAARPQAQQQQSGSGARPTPSAGEGSPASGTPGARAGRRSSPDEAARPGCRSSGPGAPAGGSSARLAVATRSPRCPRARGPCCTCPPRRRTCRRPRRPGASSPTGGRASRRAWRRGMTWVHFTTTSSPSMAVNSIGNFQSSMPSMESTSQRAMVSRPSMRPQAPST